jgi:hypothetical protein
MKIAKVKAVLIKKGGGKEIVNIEDTPHFKFACGYEKSYIDYLKFARHPDHTVEGFRELIKKFEYSKSGKIKLYKQNENILIADGLHRTAILLSLGFKTIEYDFT